MKFGKAIKVMRAVRGLTQRQLGDKVGCSATVIHWIETGQQEATEEQTVKIHQVLDFSPASDEALKTLIKDDPTKGRGNDET